MKSGIAVIALLLFSALSPVSASEATFANNVLKFDTVQVGVDTYSAELTPVPNVTPLTFTLTKAAKVATPTAYAATFVGTTLTASNVLINGTMRASARLILTGQNPYRFQLSTYSVLRSVSFDPNQTLSAGKTFYVNYTGGVLDTTKVKLKFGTTAVAVGVVDNVIAATVPAGISGAQTLAVELDGESFAIPTTIAASMPIVNPKAYVTTFANDVKAGLQTLGLPSTLIDTTALSAQVAALSETEAQQVALQLRENLDGLRSITGSSQQAAYALSVFSPTANLTECQRQQVYYLRATAVMSTGIGLISVGGLYTYGVAVLPAGVAIATVLSVSTTIIAGEMAAGYQDKLLSLNCRYVKSATVTGSPLKNNIVLTTTLNIFESRAKTVQISELYQLADSEVRSDFLTASANVKSMLSRVVSVLQKVPLLSSTAAMTSLNSLLARIKTDDTLTVTTSAQKYMISSISNSGVAGSVLSTSASTLTLLIDKKSDDLADGSSMSFTIDLYNATDDVTITVPVKLNGASLLEDLKDAAVGTWSVTNVEGKTTYRLEVKAGGTGVYKVQTATSCANGSLPVAGICEYKMTWSITRSGTKYIFNDNGFWHPGFSDPVIVERAGLTLPLTGFTVHGIGDPSAVALRYVKQ